MSETDKNLESNAPLAALESWLRGLIREEVQAASQNGHQGGDRLLNAEKAAEILGVSPGWLYRYGKHLPFTRKLAPRVLRFRAQGIQKYLATRKNS